MIGSWTLLAVASCWLKNECGRGKNRERKLTADEPWNDRRSAELEHVN